MRIAVNAASIIRNGETVFYSKANPRCMYRGRPLPREALLARGFTDARPPKALGVFIQVWDEEKQEWRVDEKATEIRGIRKTLEKHDQRFGHRALLGVLAAQKGDSPDLKALRENHAERERLRKRLAELEK